MSVIAHRLQYMDRYAKIIFVNERSDKMSNIVKVEKLCKKYGKQQVLQDVDISFETGKIYGIIGPNGAGKTTIFKSIAGLIHKTSGNIIYFDGTLQPAEACTRISFMIENPYLEMGMSAYQNMKLLAILYDVEDEYIEELLKVVGLDNVGKKKVGKFSLGMKQRLGIAMALLKKPEMVVLDEPMNGLDPKGIIEMRQLLSKLCSEQGITIVISSHILYELGVLADEFFFINDGKVVDRKTRSDIEKAGNKLEEYYMEIIER